jgi:hypothetical protein
MRCITQWLNYSVAQLLRPQLLSGSITQELCVPLFLHYSITCASAGLHLGSYSDALAELMTRLMVAPMATRFLFWKKVRHMEVHAANYPCC